MYDISAILHIIIHFVWEIMERRVNSIFVTISIQSFIIWGSFSVAYRLVVGDTTCGRKKRSEMNIIFDLQERW